MLSSEYSLLKKRINIMERKTSLREMGSVALALDDISSSLRIKDKLSSVKSAGQRDIQDSIKEERAEVIFEKLTLNELVNLFYSVENVPVMIAVKKVNIKKSFENPELLDVTMTIALFTSR